MTMNLGLLTEAYDIANEEVSWLIGTTSITHLDMSLLYHRHVRTARA